MKINVIGLGYIGLPTSLILAANGFKVVGSDIIESSVNRLNSGCVTFEEAGLQDLFNKAKENSIEFSTSYDSHADMYIVTVPTPYVSDTKKIDPKYLINAVENILAVCKEESILVIESTVSPGTIDTFVRPLVAQSLKTIHVIHAPERILPGSMINELVYNSRTIGCDDLIVGEKVKSVYSSFCKSDIVLTSIRVAEMSKVVENTFRDINIAFANELAIICNEAELDVYEVIKIANHHPRVNILQPGPGVGGHCISVDPWFLVGDYPSKANLIFQARKVNDAMPNYVLKRIKEIMNINGIDSFNKIGFYGISYKENVDDYRESPTLQISDLLKKEGISDVVYYDPFISENIIEGQKQNFDEFINPLEMLVIMVGHDQIKNINFSENLIILDTKNCLSGREIRVEKL